MSNLPSVHRGTDSAERGYQRIRLRQDTEANWLKNDPILESGEFGYVIAAAAPGQMLKIGDGTRRWSELPFLAAQGNSGSPGPAGADGHSITVYGPSNSPPSPLNTQLYDGDMWLSNGLWAKNPNFDPALITPGAKGDSGEIVGVSAVGLPTGHAPTVNNTGTTTDANLVFGIPAGALGPRGIQGPIGTVGPKGPAGDTFKVSGAVANATALPATPANLAVFITQDDSHLHIYDPASAAAGANGYVDLGAIAGPQGQSTFYSNPVATAADLPATGAAGQCILALDTGHMHSWNPATAAWVDAGQIRGPSGAGISDGHADGQIPVWSVTFDAWQPTDVKIPKTIADLADVDDVIGNLGKDCVMVWDETAQVWTDSRSIEIDDIEFDASGPGTVLEGIAAYSDSGLDPTKDTWVPSCMAVDKYLRERINLEDLLDCNVLKFATNGQVPVWNDVTSQWEPQDPSAASPIIYLGTGAWNAANVTSGADNYGMPTDTVPSPADYPPLPGDQYIDLATGVVTAFTGAPGTTTPTTRTTSAIAGGVQPGLDALIENLGGLSDVTLSSASDKQILQYEAATSQWKNVFPDFLNPANAYTKAEVDGKLAAVTTGMVHSQSVEAIRNDPPTSPATLSTYIAGTAPTGAWSGHPNQLAAWSGTAWTFEAPQAGESHLVEDVSETWHWTGTAWVKVAAASTGAVATGDLWIVGSIQTSWLNETQFRTALGLNTSEDHKWCLCDGRNVAGSRFQTITGLANVPDLRGAYLRMAGQNSNNQPDWNGEALRGFQGWITGRSRTAMTGVTNNTGSHNHQWGSDSRQSKGGGDYMIVDGWDVKRYTSDAGNHTHTVNINGGGDRETRPNSFSVNYFIKIN